MRVVNVAHGEFFMLGAVLACVSAASAATRPLASCRRWIAPLIVGAVALVAERLVLHRLNYVPEATIVATIGMLYIMQQRAPSTFRMPTRWRRRSIPILFPWFGYSGYNCRHADLGALLVATGWANPDQIGPRHAGDAIRPRDGAAFGVPVDRVYARLRPGAMLAAVAAC